MSPLPKTFDLGKLLRLQQMVKAAAETEPTMSAGIALVDAYNNLRGELFALIEGAGSESLKLECLGLFPLLDRPPPFNPKFPAETKTRLDAAAAGALVHMRQLGGWIH